MFVATYHVHNKYFSDQHNHSQSLFLILS